MEAISRCRKAAAFVLASVRSDLAFAFSVFLLLVVLACAVVSACHAYRLPTSF
jgi:hypothetical protein